MFIVKRIFPSGKRLGRYISTSAVSCCDKPRKDSQIIDEPPKEKNGEDRRQQKRIKSGYPEKVVSAEEKQKAKKSLSELLESLTVECDLKREEKENDVKDAVEVKIVKETPKKPLKSNLSELLLQAADNVAKDLGGDAKRTKQDLLEHLKTIQVSTEAEGAVKLPSASCEPSAGAEDISRRLQELFPSEGLGIFEQSSQEGAKGRVKLNIWDRLEEEELAYLARKPPRNQLEEWILWTEQGKLWRFPIDNDQGMEREAEIEFTQHVFLEEHLEPWCPKKGPLKKFMELVLVGLSKNPYLTVEDKKEHIFWYRDYFANKKKLLQELGAFGGTREIGDAAGPSTEQKP